MRRAFSQTLCRLARDDERVVLMTADLGFMVLEEFASSFPSRFYNVGVAEANMVGLATGLASCGHIPFVYSIATFASMRGYEQIRNGPILHQLPVRIVGIGGGFEYGHGGFTHHALEDFAITRTQPGLTVIVPADEVQATAALHSTYDLDGPIYYRFGKRDGYALPGLDGRFRLGRIETVTEGSDLLIVVAGSIASEALAAVTHLRDAGISATLAVVSSLRPAPVEDLSTLLARFSVALTVEEHYVDGGLGSLVCEVAAENGLGSRVVRCGVQRAPSICGGEAFLRAQCGISGEAIADAALSGLGVRAGKARRCGGKLSR